MANIMSDMKIFWLVLALVLLLIACIVLLLRKIHQLKSAKKEIDFQHTLFDIIPHPIYIRDREGRLVNANRSFCLKTDIDLQEMIGKKITDWVWFSPQDGVAYQARYLEALANEQALFDDLQVKIKDQTLNAEVWLIPYRDENHQVAGMIGGLTDITERLHLLNEVQMAKSLAEQARQRADDASQAKSHFLATMSHEIRTPISAVIGMLELVLQQSEKGVWDRESIVVAHQSATSLLALLGDVLDLAKIESGQLTLTPQRCNPQQLTEGVIQVFDGLAREKELPLELETDNATAGDVFMDPLRFRQILNNLVSNAVKFTDTGGIKVSLSSRLMKNDEVLINVRVKDTGIGIANEDQHRLFRSFSQISENSGITRGGSGLGLAICKDIVQMMNGKITLNSQPGIGTLVEVILCMPALAAQSPHSVTARDDLSSPNFRALNVLVVDDHPANRMLFDKQLNYLGHHVWLAENGEKALEQWAQGDYDLVITDCNMPVMNGYELTQHIRRMEQGEKKCIILGVTANAQHEEVIRCKNVGMDDCLFKPVTLGYLRDYLKNLGKSHALPDDISSIEKITGGDPMMTMQFCKGIINENNADLSKIVSALNLGQVDEMLSVAHRIKGIGKMLNVHSLVHSCEQLENACQSQQNLAPAVERLREAIIALESALKGRGETE